MFNNNCNATFAFQQPVLENSMFVTSSRTMQQPIHLLQCFAPRSW